MSQSTEINNLIGSSNINNNNDLYGNRYSLHLNKEVTDKLQDKKDDIPLNILTNKNNIPQIFKRKNTISDIKKHN